ncbi:YxlC family protein [Bacillus sp. Marseille-P3800]|uniref:YxlC family protein n=1 Tax=Bacillus sp. Marseille-P3800 TaxID=2014782 RepID=UPI000C085C44|nr:YxlC family protein [Bacillus sp. Marseille-P3800]
MSQENKRFKDGLDQLNRIAYKEPSMAEMLHLVKETKRKQRREAFLFIVVTLLLVNGMVFLLANVPIVFLSINIAMVAIIPAIGVLAIIGGWREKHEQRH